MDIRRYKHRYWAVYSPSDELICVCVYKKGAQNVARLLVEKTLPARDCPPCSPPDKRIALPQRRVTAASRSLRHVPSFYKRPSRVPKREEGTLP